jgi:hypothetical protein
MVKHIMKLLSCKADGEPGDTGNYWLAVHCDMVGLGLLRTSGCNIFCVL